ncbi:Outer membrane protein TolC [Tangfeifania diversioriginum]|uniref:Outer membrane protein TolC n=1 Tax=Tangfeifania diversioriginum TaxID=1168035 RepID=A0A1M6AJJ2_9BACT|nr:TolC family protein [Tangfeifania diversioriginum]SHI36601.1 Outer membrane protein TolC [Tangfeifania diversioriginum]
MKQFINIILLLFLGTLSVNAQTLEDYFREAAENNTGLKARYIEFEAALQEIPQVNALPDPTLSFGAFISPVETRVGPQRAKFSLTQMFPWFGTLKAKDDAASLRAEAKYQAFLDARNKLFYQVAAAYYPLYELNRLKKAERENIEILKSYKNIAEKNFENGKGAMTNVLRVDIMLDDATTTLEILNEKEKPLLSAFNHLLNRDEDAEVAIADSLTISPLPEQYRSDSLLANNPALNAFDTKIKAGEAAEEVAKKQGMPNLGVGLDYAVVSERPDVSLPDNGKDIVMPMVSVSIPIFRKKYDAAQKQAQLEQEQFALQKNDYINTLSAEYDNVWFNIRQTQKLIQKYKQQIETSRQTLNLLFTSYSNSGEEFEEVLRLQQQLLKYEKLKATATAEFHIAQAKINYLTAKTYNNENK